MLGDPSANTHGEVVQSWSAPAPPQPEPEPGSLPRLNPHFFRSVEELELSIRTANCLQNANLRYIGDLVQRTEAELLKTKNFGRPSLREVKAILAELGLSLGTRIPDWKRQLEAFQAGPLAARAPAAPAPAPAAPPVPAPVPASAPDPDPDPGPTKDWEDFD